MSKITQLTPDQIAQIPVIRDEFLAHGFSTAPADFEAAKVAIAGAYKMAGLDPPAIFITTRSPHEGVIAAAMLADSRLGPAVRDQVGDQVRDQVVAQVRAQVVAQVRDQVVAQVWDQVWDQVVAQVRDQVRDQVRAQVRAQVWDQVGDQVGDQVRDQVRRAFYGQHDAGWLSFYEYFARVAGVDCAQRLGPLAQLSSVAGWCWFFRGAAIITDRPELLSRDNEHRLHCETGPAMRYRDGFCIHAWHGTRVPAEWIEDKANLTPEIALTWRNIEQRRAACEILGWDSILSTLNARVINADSDPEIGTLVEVDLPDSGAERFLRVKCGTGRQFALPVPPDMETALQANAWTFGYDATTDFTKPEVRT